MKYYIYCNAQQASYAFCINSIVCRSMLPKTMRDKTASLLNDSFIFISKHLLSEDIGNTNIGIDFHPVILVVTIPEHACTVPAFLLSVNSDNIFTVSERVSVLPADDDTVLGAFIPGEIPIPFLSGVLFEDESQKNAFYKPAPDLWYPESKFGLIARSPDDKYLNISREKLSELAAECEKQLSPESEEKNRLIVNERSRYKAYLYYMVSKTQNWMTGRLKCNVESHLLAVLGEYDAELLKSAEVVYNRVFSSHPDISAFSDFLKEEDSALKDKTCAEGIMLSTIIRFLFKQDPVSFSKLAYFDEIREQLSDKLSETQAAVTDEMFNCLKNKWETLQSPDEYYNKISSSVFRAFSAFLDGGNVEAYIESESEGLTSAEIRYVFLMYGILNGMPVVNGDRKCDYATEYTIESIVLKKFPHPLLISALPAKELLGIDGTSGIIPNFEYYIGIKEAQSILGKRENAAIITALYELLLKHKHIGTKDRTAIIQYANPFRIALDYGDKVQNIECESKSELAEWFNDKAVSKIDKAIPKSVNLQLFIDKYINNAVNFMFIFKEHGDEIQGIISSEK